MEGMCCVARVRDGKKVHIDSFFDHAGPGDWIRYDDIFDLGNVFRWRGRDFFVGTIVGDEGGDVYSCATETTDKGYGLRA